MNGPNEKQFVEQMLSTYFSQNLSEVIDVTASTLTKSIANALPLHYWVNPNSSQVELIAFFAVATNTTPPEPTEEIVLPKSISDLIFFYQKILQTSDTDYAKFVNQGIDYKLSRNSSVMEAIVWLDEKGVQQAIACRKEHADIERAIKCITKEKKK